LYVVLEQELLVIATVSSGSGTATDNPRLSAAAHLQRLRNRN
jgi:hypothetical protein